MDTKREAWLKEATQLPEEKLLEKILGGEAVSLAQLEALSGSISPSDFCGMLAERYSIERESPISDATVVSLVGFDPVFLGNPFIQESIQRWRQESLYSSKAKAKLKSIGNSLIPEGATNRSSGLQPLLPMAYDQLVKRIGTFHNIASKDGTVEGIALLKRAGLLVRLVRRLARAYKMTNNADGKGTRESLIGAIKKEAERSGFRYRDLSPDFADFDPDWVLHNPGEVALEYLLEAWPNKITVEGLRKNLQRARKDQGRVKRRLPRNSTMAARTNRGSPR